MQTLKGTVKFFKEDKGFGFILCRDNSDAEQEIFFHKSKFNNENMQVRKGDIVNFGIEENKKTGKIQAVNVEKNTEEQDI